MKLSRLSQLIPFFSEFQIEQFIVRIIKDRALQIRLCHRNQSCSEGSRTPHPCQWHCRLRGCRRWHQTDSHQRRTFARGNILRLVRPSEKRTQPKCCYFGVCGGCEWQPFEIVEEEYAELLEDLFTLPNSNLDIDVELEKANNLKDWQHQLLKKYAKSRNR